MPLELLAPGSRVLTHCNTGALATGGYGSALGAVRAAFEAGRVEHVWVDETRPLLQGARLTAWELDALGIPFSVIVDGAAASLMAAGEVDAVFTGADRIAANGDVANKVGTYGLAVAAHAITALPFYVVAPTSTVDPATASGAAIPIEERERTEISSRFPAYNPAFDVTPADLVTAIVTEAGVHRAPYASSLPTAGRGSVVIDAVDTSVAAVLDEFGFDEPQFERLRARVASGELSAESNLVRGRARAALRGGPHAAPSARASRATRAQEPQDSRRFAAARSPRSCSRAAWRRASAASSRPCSRRSTA